MTCDGSGAAGTCAGLTVHGGASVSCAGAGVDLCKGMVVDPGSALTVADVACGSFPDCCDGAVLPGRRSGGENPT